jgi:hypothetical protein
VERNRGRVTCIFPDWCQERTEKAWLGCNPLSVGRKTSSCSVISTFHFCVEEFWLFPDLQQCR